MYFLFSKLFIQNIIFNYFYNSFTSNLHVLRMMFIYLHYPILVNFEIKNYMFYMYSDMSWLWVPDPWQYLRSSRQYFAGNSDPQKKYLTRSVDPQWIPRKGRGKGDNEVCLPLFTVPAGLVKCVYLPSLRDNEVCLPYLWC